MQKREHNRPVDRRRQRCQDRRQFLAALDNMLAGKKNLRLLGADRAAAFQGAKQIPAAGFPLTRHQRGVVS